MTPLTQKIGQVILVLVFLGEVLLHYYVNFSRSEQRFSYPFAGGIDLLTNNPVAKESTLELKPWDLAIISER